MNRRFLAAWVGLSVVATLAGTAHAQLGTGWTQFSPVKKIHLDDEAGLQTFNWSSYQSVGSGSICADYSSSGTTETFRILDNRSNRAEIRLQNEYSTGRRQFEGYVTFNSPLNDESLFQIFGSTSGATLCMMRGYASSNGLLRVVGGIGDLVTNCYGVEKRVNVIHDQNNYVRFYINGVQEGEFQENEQVDNYWKYGCYGTLTTPAVTVRWRNVRCFRDGQPPGQGGGFSGFYRIMARHSGKAVVVEGASTADGADVFQYSYTSSTPRNDEWEIISVGSGFYRIMNRHSGKAMVVEGASTVNGADVIQWTYGGSNTNDEWAIESVGGGYYRIVNRNSGKALDVYQAGTANGVNVQQWDYGSGGAHKEFQLISVP